MTEHQRCQETRKLLDQGAQLIDVRTEGEFASGALPGAINLPLQAIPGLHHQLDKSVPVVVYCGSGMRSQQAKSLLERAGVCKVHDLGCFHNIQRC